MRCAALLAVVLAGAACGDNARQEPVLTARSGSRLALQWYGYADGTRQPEANELYDTLLHTRCAVRPWEDGVVRCVPVADDAVFTDAACTTMIGRGLTIDEPTHFLVRALVDDEVRPVRLYQAGDEVDAVDQFFHQQGETCLGPFFNPPGITYHEVLGEIAAVDLVAIHDGELGDGRLALRVRETDDGVWLPLGLRDRELDVACTAVPRPDGGATCEPAEAAPAEYFRDPACAEPVVVVSEEAPVPAIARLVEPAGCARYHAVGAELSTSLYRRDGETCRPATVAPPSRVFAVDAALELPALERTVETLGDRRLQRIIVDDGAVRVFDQRLFDTAMRADCRRHRFDDDVTRCIPATVATALRLFTPTCVVAVDVAELPVRACERPEFAATTAAAGLQLHAIGAPVVGPLHHWSGGQCRPYAVADGFELHALGPALDPTAFMAALYFGER